MIDKETFLKAALPERQVDLDGQVVTVRGLSRAEVVGLQGLTDNLPGLEQKILLLGFVDPPLTDGDVTTWYGSAPAGHIDKVVTAISQLSGMAEGAAKSRVPKVRK